MLQNQQNPQLTCNRVGHSNQIISAICTKYECEQHGAICQKCMFTFHKFCGDQVVFLEDLPNEISKMENLYELINKILESLIQQLVKLQKNNQLCLNVVREYQEMPNMTNLNNIGTFLQPKDIDMNKVTTGNEIICKLIENYLNPMKPKELTQQQIEQAKELNKKGEFHYNSGEYQKAIQYYDQALSINSESHEFWNNKGLALYYLHKNQEAIKCYDQALKISPNDQTLWNNKGLALYNLHKYQEAIECYDKSISIQPTAIKYYLKSLSLENLNQLKEAEVCLMKALEMDLNYEDAQNSLKNIQEKLKN